MDPVSLAPVVLSILAPYAKKVAGKLAEKSLEALPDVVGKIWDTVKRKMEKKPETKDLTADLAAAPESRSVQGAFEYQLKKLLENDEAFAKRLEELVVEAEKQGVTYSADLKGGGAIAQGRGATAVGAGGIYIGGKASDDVIIAGDHNSVNTPKKARRK